MLERSNASTTAASTSARASFSPYCYASGGPAMMRAVDVQLLSVTTKVESRAGIGSKGHVSTLVLCRRVKQEPRQIKRVCSAQG